ncbi:uncharacterized protein BX663DRAFT_562264 [Cokeromyces recurvatus]|uniref:uncharacterized protein n=1 Tax=Cokeromyces recurvatus TaxID=90255 RepID=UPI0022207C6F|nr:uncharacterized protein BX663DRAFT_562264 [Cokeromyces recurvatus]KAI7901341.1 hypothetical protein BX663DRAFT_562264 [Cokeromyces recurvatus]
MDEEASLKQRLSLDERHVKLLEKKFIIFLQNLYNEPVESAQLQLENLLILLLNYQTSLERHPLTINANNKEIEQYKSLGEQTDVIKEQAGGDIESLREQLIKEQKKRNQKLEYDRVAREILKYDTRDAYIASIDKLQRDIDLLEREKKRKLEAFERRKRNLTTLVTNLKELQKSVDDERSIITEDQQRFVDMERGYVSSDNDDDIGLSDNESENESENQPTHSTYNRFQERGDDDEDDDDDEEEGIVVEMPTTVNEQVTE